jgi:O-antigen ligase
MQEKIANVCLFLTPALTFAFPGSYWLGVLMFSAIGISVLTQKNYQLLELFALVRRVPAIWGFLVFTIFHLCMTAFHGEPSKDFGNVIPFLLAPLVLIGVFCSHPNPKYFWLGCGFGALLAFGIAINQVYLLNTERAYGFNNPILFGNTAIILGSGALVGWFFSERAIDNFHERTLLIVGGISGLLTSLLSGSKGGWLSLLTVVALLIIAITRSMTLTRRILVTVGIVIVITSVLTLTPKLPVVYRVIEAYHGTVEWVKTGRVTEGSASMRLEAIKTGVLVGMQSPLVGLGKQGELNAFRDAVSMGLVQKELLDVNVIDNDFVGLFSSKGLVGVIGALAVHMGVLLTFFRYRNESDRTIKALTSLGMLLAVFFFEFGLSTSIFGRSIFRAVYASWAIILAGLMLTEIRRLDTTAAEN